MNTRYGAAIIAGLALMSADVAQALPPGKHWTNTEKFVTPGHAVFNVVRLGNTTTGGLFALGTGDGGLPREGQGLEWGDSVWRVQWSSGFDMTILLPTLGEEDVPLVWAAFETFFTGTRYESWLIGAEVQGGRVSEPDTVASIRSGVFRYSAASTKRRRWVSAGDASDLRLFYSDTVHVWHEVAVAAGAYNGTGLAPIGDTTAAVAWAGIGTDGLHFGILKGVHFEEGTPPPEISFPGLSALPHFRVRPSGGHWLAWSTHEGHAAIASVRGGAWSDAESLKCAYRSNGKIPDAWINNTVVEFSYDSGEYPIVVWGGYNYETGAEATCVCVPTDSGFTVAEDLPGLEGSIRTGAARDRWGDAWVAWHTLGTGMHFVHTYTTATCSAPSFEGSGVAPLARWSLSEPAPGSWWTVLRSVGGGAFDSVATLRATADTMMAWTDSTAPRGVGLSYRLRRECLDRRYQWLSPEANWYPRTPSLGLWLHGPHPVSDAIEFAVTGSGSGVLESRLYDLQGRLIATELTGTRGSGVDEARMDLAGLSPPVRSGIYFLRVTDGAGHVSNPLRIAVIR